MANCKMIRDEASFSKLSPSKIVENLFGSFTNLVIALALTASGGETIPPSKNPKDKVNPGINQYEAKATPTALINTTIKAKESIILRHLNNSLNEQPQAASYNIGGKKSTKTKSGSNFTLGKPGIKLITNPTITSKTG
jgi:hypothetical protein